MINLLGAGEKLGLATSPPYLSLISKGNKNENNVSFINGVSFASAGAGIFDGTDERYVSHQHYILLNEDPTQISHNFFRPNLISI